MLTFIRTTNELQRLFELQKKCHAQIIHSSVLMSRLSKFSTACSFARLTASVRTSASLWADPMSPISFTFISLNPSFVHAMSSNNRFSEVWLPFGITLNRVLLSVSSWIGTVPLPSNVYVRSLAYTYIEQISKRNQFRTKHGSSYFFSFMRFEVERNNSASAATYKDNVAQLRD